MSTVNHCDPEILGGTPVFVGTRVPVAGLFDYVLGGHSLTEFVDDFPTVRADQAAAAVARARVLVARDAGAALA